MVLYILWFGLGAVCGGAGVWSMRRTVMAADPAGGSAAGRIALGIYLRMGLAAALLLGAVQTGPGCAVAAAAGHWLAGRLSLALGLRRR
ncbi:MAG: hypothetical protein JW929_01380 [Anaerolineales bacterium]|nr:hypothetical protein [Anaerolineales bacterium]